MPGPEGEPSVLSVNSLGGLGSHLKALSSSHKAQGQRFSLTLEELSMEEEEPGGAFEWYTIVESSLAEVLGKLLSLGTLLTCWTAGS